MGNIISSESNLPAAFAGGAIIAAASSLSYCLFGKIMGVSGLCYTATECVPSSSKGSGRAAAQSRAFIAGVLLSGAAYALYHPAAFADSPVPQNIPMTLLAGVLTGVGARVGSGCTSGHGVAGLARMSPRSLAAVITFMATGITMASATAALVAPSPSAVFTGSLAAALSPSLRLAAALFAAAVIAVQCALGLVQDTVAFAFIGGLFGGGLGVSQMSSPAKVIGFLRLGAALAAPAHGAGRGAGGGTIMRLDAAHAWDPSLMGVMGAAVAINLVTFSGIAAVTGGRALNGDRLQNPGAGIGVTRRLVAGAALFGVGWGLGGLCPGPGVFSLGAGALSALLWCVGMWGGLWLGQAVGKDTRTSGGTRTPTTE
eukprot:TRINITY_DN2384_c0_g1_i1.p1 TRINITY_DN2384_c0_g1~~TRINITY_DN2384_c0_g1_i1.p1  ORF type:complete len:388 (-),score=48.43 TRINITY_DN2384_c0_g1_i1:373-1485(-)